MSTAIEIPRARPGAKEIPDPYADPIGYLLAKGWRTNGNGNGPTDPLCICWLDPTKPLQDEVKKVPHMERELPDGSKESIFRTVITPAVEPVNRHQALSLQMERERGAPEDVQTTERKLPSGKVVIDPVKRETTGLK